MITYCYYDGSTNEWNFEKIIVNLTSASAMQNEIISSKEEIKRIGKGIYYRKKVDGRNQIFSAYGSEIYPKTSFQTIDGTNVEVTDISFYEISTPNDKNLIGMNLHFDNIATIQTENRKNISQIESGRNAALSRILQPTKLHEKPGN